VYYDIISGEEKRHSVRDLQPAGLIAAGIHIKENFFLEMERKSYYIAYFK